METKFPATHWGSYFGAFVTPPVSRRTGSLPVRAVARPTPENASKVAFSGYPSAHSEALHSPCARGFAPSKMLRHFLPHDIVLEIQQKGEHKPLAMLPLHRSTCANPHCVNRHSNGNGFKNDFMCLYICTVPISYHMVVEIDKIIWMCIIYPQNRSNFFNLIHTVNRSQKIMFIATNGSGKDSYVYN